VSGILSPVLLGTASGLRSFSGPAALAARGHFPVLLRRGAIVAAAGELVADKLPTTPSRTEPGPLVVRVALGAFAGARSGGARGAGTAAAAAAVATFAGHRARQALSRRLSWPDARVALIEDAVAYSLAAAGALP
jgi:uncharacterized membrane protein